MWDTLKKHVSTCFREHNQMREANTRIGKWLSAAQDDPTVCQEMKDDIDFWFKNSKFND